MFNLFLKICPLLCIVGGVATGMYGVYALIIGKVVVESRTAGVSVYLINAQPGPFFGLIAFYLVCAVVLTALGFLARK